MESITVLFILALVLFLGSCGGSTDTRLKIELNGDSIVYGQGLQTRPSTYLKDLLPNADIEDRSQVGLTLHSLVKGYSTPWVNGPVPNLGVQSPFSDIERTSDIVVISLGGNDAYSNLSSVVFETNLRTVVQKIKDEGRIPILTGIVQLTPSSQGFDQAIINRTIELNSITQKVSKDMKVVSANWDTVEYRGLIDTLDGIHRTQPASDLLVQRLAETIRSIK